MSSVEAVPSAYGSVTPRLIVRDAAMAIAFYAKAFGATERTRLVAPNRRIAHAEITVGDSVVMLSEEMPETGMFGPQTLGGAGVSIHLYVPDADATIARAIAAGATIVMPARDMFWGDRYGAVADPFGHRWAVATHLRDVSSEEIAAAMKPAPPAT